MAVEKRKTKGTADPVDAYVGQRLRIRRSLLGLSQEKLAEAIGLTFQQIQKYERGMNRISAGRLYQFSKILDVPVSYFFEQMTAGGGSEALAPAGFSDTDQEAYSAPNLLQQKETVDLLRVYYSIRDPSLRKDIFKFVKAMADRVQAEESN